MPLAWLAERAAGVLGLSLVVVGTIPAVVLITGPTGVGTVEAAAPPPASPTVGGEPPPDRSGEAAARRLRLEAGLTLDRLLAREAECSAQLERAAADRPHAAAVAAARRRVRAGAGLFVQAVEREVGDLEQQSAPGPDAYASHLARLRLIELAALGEGSPEGEHPGALGVTCQSALEEVQLEVQQAARAARRPAPGADVG